MKSKSKSSRVLDRYGMIEALEPRIAPATVTPGLLPTSPANYKTVTVGSSLLLKAGDVLTTGSGTGGAYLMYVEAGEVLVHTTDLNNNKQFDYNEITGLSVGPGTRIVSFVDIHGDVVTDLNPDGTLTDSDNNASNGRDGRVLLDSNIAAIDLRSLEPTDFTASATQSLTAQVNAHLAMSSYSIYGNIYAGGGLGLANDPTSGLQIDTSGSGLQTTAFNGSDSTDYYQVTEPVIGSIYVGSAASGQYFNFGASGQGASVNGAPPLDIHGQLTAFVPSPGEAGASIYNISSVSNVPFSIGTLEAGNGGFNAPGGNIGNVALQGDNAGVYKLIAGNAGNGTVGQPGGSIINFSETGTIISEVVLQSGNGGTGLTGPGGHAGDIVINSANSTVGINAHLVIQLGSGGDGYSGGGAGGSVPTGTFVTPIGKLTSAQDLVATMHTAGAIGYTPNTLAAGGGAPGTAGSNTFDFNNDGLSDAVFATQNPNQLVVALGAYDSGGEYYSIDYHSYIYLNSPVDVQSIVVGDFNGAMIPGTHTPAEDIAVAGGGPNYAGVEVYISKYNLKTGAFEGFSDPIFTPLPSLTAYGYDYSSVPVTRLLAGDFNGSGVLGLAVLASETVLPGAVHPVLIYLNGETDATHPYGTGYFYADFYNGNTPFVDLAPFDTLHGTLIPTALTEFTPNVPAGATNVPNAGVFNGQDVIIEANTGATGFAPLVYQDSAVTGISYGGVGALPGGGFGNVLPPGTLIPTAFHLFGLAVTQDQSNPTIADIVAVSKAPQGFVVTLAGDGVGDFKLTSAPNLGIDIAYGTTFQPEAVVTVPASTGAVASGLYSDVAVLDYNTAGGDDIFLLNVFFNPKLGTAGYEDATTTAVIGAIAPANGRNLSNIAFDVYYPHPAFNSAIFGSGPGEFGFITGDPAENFPDYQGFSVSQPYLADTSYGKAFAVDSFTLAPFKDAGYFITAGNGGNSQSGPGGAGGTLGENLALTLGSANGVTAGTGVLSIIFPDDPTYEGTARLQAGNGGNGFNGGGAGGAISDVSLNYNQAENVLTGSAVLYAGNGGESLTGAGGNGGSLSQLYIITGDLFVAGNGGIGAIGGNGGAVLGNTEQGVITAETNNYDPAVAVKSGDGATGIVGGGTGGVVNSFVEEFPPVFGTPEPGFFDEGLNYVAGSGGNAVAGHAGTGGSVLNSSPYALQNNLIGDIFLQGGNGGDGLYGGSGGIVLNFDQNSTIKDQPYSLTVIGGTGGTATLGTGGTGGGVSGIVGSADGGVNQFGEAVGTLYTFDYSNQIAVSDAQEAITSTTSIVYNRIIAGAGGMSLGGAGGIGGSVSNINSASVAEDSALALAAGAGGQGLTAGGAGGNVATATVDAGSAASIGKILIVAGDGGASISGRPVDPTNVVDVVDAIGGISGPGGAGGSITNITQPANTGTHVDLIAGNGGATINHSVAYGNSPVNPKTGAQYDNSGVGGSVLNINVTGSIGNSDPLVAIKSYNDIFATAQFPNGETMQNFVDDFILGLNGNHSNLAQALTDSVGNVGIVAGGAGQVESQYGPADALIASNNGIAGSVSNVQAQNIMSIVAFNVDDVQLVESLTDYSVTISGGILGANKEVYYNPATGLVSAPNPAYLNTLNYINAEGQYVNTPIPGGGELIDGAFVAKNIRVLQSIRDFEGTE